MLIPNKRKLCSQCAGILTLQRRYKSDIKMQENDGTSVTVTRITEEWRCHNGHLHMVNTNENPKLVINT